MKRLHVLVMLLMACFWVLSGVIQAQVVNTYNIGNLVWNDLNKNGIQDPGEPGIPDVEVSLYWVPFDGYQAPGTISSSELSAMGTFLKSTKTDINGNYSFGNLSAGKYYIKITPKEGWAVSPMLQGTSDEKDSDIIPFLFISKCIFLSYHDENNHNDHLGVDAGLFQPQESDLVTIGDMVFNDCNHNGVLDCDEKGIAGVIVKLYSCDLKQALGTDEPLFSERDFCPGMFLESTITDLNGHYEFDHILPGKYAIEVCLPGGYRIVTRPNCPTECNPVEPTNFTGCMMFNACTKNLDIDFAVCHDECSLPGIGDFVWNDANHDGLQTMGEVGMKGVKATLYRCDVCYDLKQGSVGLSHYPCSGIKVGSVTSDENGKYLFSNLIPGYYFIRFEAPYGYLRTVPNRLVDDKIDSDVDSISCNGWVETACMYAYAGTDLTVDAGFYLNHDMFASVSDRVWRDDDGDGEQDPREVGVPGVTVQLYISKCTCSGRTDNFSVESPTYSCSHGDGKLVATTTTDENGMYFFDYVVPDHYYLKVVVPPCFTLTQFHKENIPYDRNSDFWPKSATTRCLNLDARDFIDCIDAGLVPKDPNAGMIGDLVWNDANKNGVQDCGEKGICGVTVELHKSDGGATVATVVTDQDGKYLFTNVPANVSYFVKFILPAQYQFTAQNADPNDAVDSDPCPEKWITANFTMGAGQYNMTIDAGMYTAAPCTVSNYVWNDKNGNGQKDNDEAGVADVTVELYCCESSDLAQSVKTDGNGFYTFSNIIPGNYRVDVKIPSGYLLGKLVKNSDGVSTESTSCVLVNKGATSIGLPVALVLDPNVSVAVASLSGIPTSFGLSQNYPNPFNPSTTIRFAIPEAGMYTLKVYNMLGQEVATLINGELSVGYKEVNFDASKLTSGVYIYRLTGNNVVMTKKMMLNK